MAVCARCTLFALLFTSCDVGEVDPIQLSLEAQARGMDPCHDPAVKKRVNVRRSADGRFVGTNRRDIILGTNGDDVIFGLSGDDLIICRACRRSEYRGHWHRTCRWNG